MCVFRFREGEFPVARGGPGVVRHSFDVGSLGPPRQQMPPPPPFDPYAPRVDGREVPVYPPQPVAGFVPRVVRSASEALPGTHVDDDYIDAMRIRKRVHERSPDGVEAETQGDKRFRRSALMSPRSLKILQDWVSTHPDFPFPTDPEKLQLSRDTGLDVQQIELWFTNNRERISAANFAVQNGAPGLSPSVSRACVCCCCCCSLSLPSHVLTLLSRFVVMSCDASAARCLVARSHPVTTRCSRLRCTALAASTTPSRTRTDPSLRTATRCSRRDRLRRRCSSVRRFRGTETRSSHRRQEDESSQKGTTRLRRTAADSTRVTSTGETRGATYAPCRSARVSSCVSSSSLVRSLTVPVASCSSLDRLRLVRRVLRMACHRSRTAARWRESQMVAGRRWGSRATDVRTRSTWACSLTRAGGR